MHAANLHMVHQSNMLDYRLYAEHMHTPACTYTSGLVASPGCSLLVMVNDLFLAAQSRSKAV